MSNLNLENPIEPMLNDQAEKSAHMQGTILSSFIIGKGIESSSIEAIKTVPNGKGSDSGIGR